MRIGIDVAKAQFYFVLNSSKPENCIEGDATVSRTYSALALEQLQRLYKNTTGHSLTTTNYSAALQACKNIAIRLLTTERSYAYDLEKEDG